MESKLNYSAIEAYSKQYSNRLVQSLYENKTHISGDELLNTPVKQVGLFILQDIYANWTNEAAKLRSSYFNYESAEVKTGLQKLMNILSKNISVAKEALLPLLENAVYQTLIIIFSPYSYFKNLIINQNISFDEFEALIKFIAINKKAAEAIFARMQSEKEELQDRNVLIDDVFTTLESPENTAEFIRTFSHLVVINEQQFYVTAKTQVLEEDDDEDISNDVTLNDRFSSARYETLADKLMSEQSGKKGSLKSMLSINQKFMFINDLFNDNQEDFNKVLDFLEGCESKEVAISFITNNYLKHNIWNPNAPQVREFMVLLDKKFS